MAPIVISAADQSVISKQQLPSPQSAWNASRKSSRYRHRTIAGMPTIGEARQHNHVTSDRERSPSRLTRANTTKLSSSRSSEGTTRSASCLSRIECSVGVRVLVCRISLAAFRMASARKPSNRRWFRFQYGNVFIHVCYVLHVHIP